MELHVSFAVTRVISPCHLTGEGRPSHAGNTRVFRGVQNSFQIRSLKEKRVVKNNRYMNYYILPENGKYEIVLYHPGFNA